MPKYEREMVERFDTHFFVGTVHTHPNAWIIVGLFYPPPRPQVDTEQLKLTLPRRPSAKMDGL